MLGSSDAWRCESCGVPVRARKEVRVEGLPKVLVIQLKRFGYDRLNKCRKGEATPPLPPPRTPPHTPSLGAA